MVTFPISLPEDVKAEAEALARMAGFTDLGDYFASLIAAGGNRPLDDATEAALLEGLEEPGRQVTRSDWDAKIQAFEERMRLKDRP